MIEGTRLEPTNRTTAHVYVASGVTRNEIQISHKTQGKKSNQDDQFQEQGQHAQIPAQEQKQTQSIAKCSVTFRANRAAISTDRVACQAID